MTKKEFIWLGIRFLGIAWLVFTFGGILSAIGSFIVMLDLLPVFGMSEKVIFVTLFASVFSSTIDVLIIIYLLFFGKFIFNIVHGTSSHPLDMIIEKQNYTEILIRFIGLWWVWKVIFQLFGLLSRVFYTFIFTHIAKLLDDGTSQETMKELIGKIPPFQQSMLWGTLLNTLIYAFLAWYFLKHGKLFIKLLNRLWLGKSKQDLNQNPV